MIDFKELSQNGDDFELLVRELLYNRGLEVYWSGKGADGGRDLLCIERHKGNFREIEKRWVVQCKHNAISNKSVGTSELYDIVGVCDEHNATGYILVCTTFPSSALVRKLEEIEKNRNITTCFWDARYIEKELLKPVNWSVANQYFPKSTETMGWRISTINTYFWHASFKKNIFYMATRIGSNYNFFLSDIENCLSHIQSYELPESHIIRLRAAYFDDKYTNYKLYLDYLIPLDDNEDEWDLEATVEQFDSFKVIDGVCYELDIMTYRYNIYSDNFDKDHQDYYERYLDLFCCGGSRNGCKRYVYSNRLSGMEITEKTVCDDFLKLCDTLERVNSITILKKTNAKIEFIDQFTENFAWNSIFSDASYDVDNFFDAQIRFVCNDFSKLKELVGYIPQSVNKHFELCSNYIVLPDTGLEDEEDIYTLKFSVHPATITSKIQLRLFLNQYLREAAEGIEGYLDKQKQ